MQELAKPKARKMWMLADEAEALAIVRLEMINIEAEEELLACSESGSSNVALSKTSKTKSVFQLRVGSEILAKSSTTNRVDSAAKIKRCPEFNFDTRLSAKTPSFAPVKLDQDTTRPNPAINRINNRTKRVNAWLNDETRQEAPLRIELETVSPKVMQKNKYRDCGAAKVPDSAPINADRKTGASLPSQTYDRAKQTLSNIYNHVCSLICSPILTVKVGNSTLHLRRKLLTTVAILLSFFTKTKFENLCRRVPLRNVNSRCCEHLALENHMRWLTCFVHL